MSIMDEQFEGLQLELTDGILCCRLANGARNPLDHGLHRQLERFFQELGREEDHRWPAYLTALAAKGLSRDPR